MLKGLAFRIYKIISPNLTLAGDLNRQLPPCRRGRRRSVDSAAEDRQGSSSWRFAGGSGKKIGK